MGNVFSFFKKPKGTKEQLEDLENEIDKIEEYRISALVRERNCNALLIVSSVILYIFGLGYLYFDYNHSKSYVYKAVALCFLLLVPILVYYTKNLVGIYYKWVKETNDMKRVALFKLKKKILSKVQETETFNDAKMILERFDPNALRNMSMSLNNLSNLERESAAFSYRPSTSRPSTTATQNTPRIMSPPTRHSQVNNMSGVSNNLVSFSNPANFSATPRHALNRTVKPVLPQNRSVVEKVVDYIFADGPSNRFALICGKCFAHNGMALPDEFEYISYICAYCSHFNPARKMRPIPPKVDFTKAIEGPKVEEVDEDQDSTVKITEISTELNKTIELQSEANEIGKDKESTKAESNSDSIPFADENVPDEKEESSITTSS